MARLWEDGFDHYGTDESNMLDGSYGTAAGTLSTTRKATGTHSFYMDSTVGLVNFNGLRKVLPTAKDKLGAAARFYFDALPGELYDSAIFDFLSADPDISQLGFYADPNGCIRIVRGATMPASRGDVLINDSGVQGVLIAQTDPLLTAAAQNHVEVQAYHHDTAGWVRIAVNGIHRFEETGLNTKYDTTKFVSVAQHRPIVHVSDNGRFYMDDYYIYDFTGDSSVDTDFCPTVDGSGIATSYIGELQVWPLFADADTSEADWAKSTGTDGYALIDEATPNDADYISSTASGDLSEFALEDLPVEITYIRGLGIHARMSKSDSGAAMVKLGMKSVAATDDADERPLTTAATYWRDMINVDPDSSARWTRASLNAAWLRLTRSA